MLNIIYCPVCGKNIRFRKSCSGCGYVPARDYEMYPTLNPILGNTKSIPVKRQAWEKERLQKEIDGLLQPVRDQLKEQGESAKSAVKAVDLMKKELVQAKQETEKARQTANQAAQEAEKAKLAANQAKQEAEQAKQRSSELEKKLISLEAKGTASSRTASTGNTTGGTASTRSASAKTASSSKAASSTETASSSKTASSTSAKTAASSSGPFHSNITIMDKTCTFGTYPQNADGTIQPILWRVLDIDKVNRKALLLSDKILDSRPYYAEYGYMNWEKAGKSRKGLRYWLNHDFLRIAFPTKAEQDAILTTTVEPHADPKHDSDQGNAVKDKIFLLSAEEVIKYLSNTKLEISGTYAKIGSLLALAHGTLYVKKNRNLYQESNGKSRWWLRSVGNHGYGGMVVRHDGDIDLYGISVQNTEVGVRPALWVYL